MKKKNFIIIISLLVILLASLIVLVVRKSKQDKENKISEELKMALATFDIRLNDTKTEYIIYDLKDDANYVGSNITIPDSIDNIPVTKLLDTSGVDFEHYSKIEKLTLGKNINYVGTTLSIDQSIICGENFLTNARSLVSINVKEGNKYFSSIDGVLYNKDQTILFKYPLKKVTLNEGAVHSFNIPDTVNEIYEKAFYLNTSIQMINFGKNIKYIGDYAFSGCSSLNRINLNTALESIGNYAFERCINLSEINLPKSITNIGMAAFSKCVNLTSITFNSVPNLQVNLITGSTKCVMKISEGLYDSFIAKLKEIGIVNPEKKVEKIEDPITQ